MLNRLYITTKAPRVSTSPHRALLRMLKVEWGMLNSHSSSLSLAGVRRACPALKPDAADQVLLKNRAGFAAFSKGRAFHHVGNRIAARVTGRRGPAGPCPAHYGQKRAAGAIRAGGDAGITRRLSETYSAGYRPLGPRPCLGFFHYCGASDPARCRMAVVEPSGRWIFIILIRGGDKIV